MGGFIIVGIVCLVMPYFLDEENLLVKIFEDYLQYEPIIAVAIFLFLCSALFTKKNKDTHVAAANKVLQFVLPISVGIGLFERRIDLCFWPNWVVVVFAYTFYFLLLVNNSKMIEDKNLIERQSSDISYNPVEEVEQLFPQHKAQAERLANIISDSSSEPFSICLSGQWGTGKTSVINGVTELLRKKGNDNYAFIRINAIELDNKNTLLNYFMSEVKACLKEKGIYVGVASEYKAFLTSMVGTVTTESFGIFFEKRIFGNEKDYRKQKSSLENLLSTAFGKGKLVLIVDDIERCQPDVAREYLFLIKEVATMKNCVSIFVTDYNVLLKLFEDDTNAQITDIEGGKNEFLDKFFNYRIDLYDEEPEDIFAFYNRSFKEDDPVFTSIQEIVGMSPGTWYKNILDKMDMRIEKQEEKNNRYHFSEKDRSVQENILREMKEERAIFVQYLGNPRCAVKFYNTFRRNVHRCHKQLFEFETGELNKDLICKFIRERNIGQIVAFLSFIEVCMPDELQQIIKNGAEYIEPSLYDKNASINKERELLIEIASVTVYEERSEFSKRTGYMKMEMRRFINKFLEPNAELNQLIKPFTTQEDEWLDAIENEDEMLMESEWNRMVRMILEKKPDDKSGVTLQWKKDKLTILMKFAKEKVEQEAWKIDRVFSVFEDDKRGSYFANGKGMLQVFWDYLQNLNATTTLSEKTVNNTIDFAGFYSYNKVDSAYQLFRLIVSYEESEKMENIKEELLNASRTIEENLLQFVNKICEYIPDLCRENDGWHEKFQAITKYIREFLEEKGLLKYKDIKEEVECMLDSVNELYCLSKILEWIQNDSNIVPKKELTEKDYLQVDETIQYFEKILKHPEQYLDTDVEQQFSKFFKYLKNSANLKLDSKQIEQLHDLVGIFVEKTASYSLFYRKVLLQISLRSDEQRSGNVPNGQ